MEKVCNAAALAITAVVLLQAQQPVEFEVASVKQDKTISWVRRPWSPNFDCEPIAKCGVSGNRFVEKFASLDDLLMDAYKVRRHQIVNAPAWADTGQDVYDVDARAAGQTLPLDQARLMLQALLADRFQLKIHHETRELPVYALVAGKGGSKLTPSDKPCDLPGLQVQPRDGKSGDKTANKNPDPEQSALMGIQAWTHMPEMLEGRLDRPVVDKTGYDAPTYCMPTGDAALVTLILQLGPGGGAGRGGDPQNRTAIPDADSTGPSIFTAVEDLWGLKLEAQKAPVDVIVIDHVERPSDN